MREKTPDYLFNRSLLFGSLEIKFLKFWASSPLYWYLMNGKHTLWKLQTRSFNYNISLQWRACLFLCLSCSLLTLSKSERVAFKAPSGRPNGKQYLKRYKILQVVQIDYFLAGNMLQFDSYSNSRRGSENAFYFFTLCYVNLNSHHICVYIMYICVCVNND
jgi:hypothetical protein